MTRMSAIHSRIDQLDLTLFSAIAGQTSDDDRRSLLALQSAYRQWKGRFTILEIGSYEGGSLQAYVADPACEHIISIDPRPAVVLDQRGSTWDYSRVSAEDMLKRLAAVPDADVRKVRAITAGTDTLRAADLVTRPDFCFLDGEHTDAAVLRDARFCLEASAPDCAMVFHDANIVYNGLRTLLDEIEASGREFRAYNLASVVFVIELGACRLSGFAPLSSWRDQNYKGYLDSLLRNDHFREIARRHERLGQHPLLAPLRKMGLVAAAKRLLGAR